MKTIREQNRIQKTRALTLDAETSDKLDQLAKQFAEGSRSRMVRMLIRKEWATAMLDETFRLQRIAKEQL